MSSISTGKNAKKFNQFKKVLAEINRPINVSGEELNNLAKKLTPTGKVLKSIIKHGESQNVAVGEGIKKLSGKKSRGRGVKKLASVKSKSKSVPLEKDIVSKKEDLPKKKNNRLSDWDNYEDNRSRYDKNYYDEEEEYQDDDDLSDDDLDEYSTRSWKQTSFQKCRDL